LAERTERALLWRTDQTGAVYALVASRAFIEREWRQKHLRWASRYPVPVAPASAVEQRGFDYECGVQDHAFFQELFERAKGAYDRARLDKSAWERQTGLEGFRSREAEWMAVATQWLHAVRAALVQHCAKLGNGDRASFA
jgi:hypothetical protein